jgi:hypothetical protein
VPRREVVKRSHNSGLLVSAEGPIGAVIADIPQTINYSCSQQSGILVWNESCWIAVDNGYRKGTKQKTC